HMSRKALRVTALLAIPALIATVFTGTAYAGPPSHQPIPSDGYVTFDMPTATLTCEAGMPRGVAVQVPWGATELNAARQFTAEVINTSVPAQTVTANPGATGTFEFTFSWDAGVIGDGGEAMVFLSDDATDDVPVAVGGAADCDNPEWSVNTVPTVSITPAQ